MYAQVYPTRHKTVRTVAEKLFNDYIPRFGFPFRLHSGQCAEVEQVNCCFQVSHNAVPSPGKRASGDDESHVVVDAQNPSRIEEAQVGRIT